MNQQKLPNLVNIAIFTLITILAWIGFGVFRQVTKEPEPEVNQEILEPLDPTLDTSTLNQLESRVYLSDPEVEALVGQTIVIEEEEESVLPSPTPISGSEDEEGLNEIPATEDTGP